jgi:hypothetical protein
VRVWELCNKIKGTNCTRETIRSWSIMNKICPVEFAINLDCDGTEVKQIGIIADKVCSEFGKCDYGCLEKFLDIEVDAQC